MVLTISFVFALLLATTLIVSDYVGKCRRCHKFRKLQAHHSGLALWFMWCKECIYPSIGALCACGCKFKPKEKDATECVCGCDFELKD